MRNENNTVTQKTAKEVGLKMDSKDNAVFKNDMNRASEDPLQILYEEIMQLRQEVDRLKEFVGFN